MSPPKQTGGAAPPVDFSVAVFVGTPGNDARLRLARRWVSDFVATVNQSNGNNAQVGTLTSGIAFAEQLLEMQRVSQGNQLTDSNQALGGIASSTLILVTEALPAQGSSGIAFYSGARGRGPSDVLCTIDHLAFMQLGTTADGIEVITQSPSLSTQTDAMQTAVKDTGAFVEFVLWSKYKQVYLCAIGELDATGAVVANRSLSPFAKALQLLIKRPVWFNDTAVILDAGASGAVTAHVGLPGSEATGQGYDPANKGIKLVSQESKFLPGFEKSAP